MKIGWPDAVMFTVLCATVVILAMINKGVIG